MSDLIVNPFPATGGDRTHLVTEAVVSAYLREITPSRRAPVGIEASKWSLINPNT